MNSEASRLAPVDTAAGAPAPREPRRKKKIVIVEASDTVEAQAHDVAETKLAESLEQQSGIKGFARRIWKHNLFLEYYRQKEIHKARQAILSTGNIYEGEEGATDHDAGKRALVEQFSSEYDEAIHTEAGEHRDVLGAAPEQGQRDRELAVKSEIQKLIRDFATQDLESEQVRACFTEEKNRIFSTMKGVKGDVIDKGNLYADNLLEIAREVHQNIEHGERLEDLDLDFDVIVGKAKADVRTEVQFNAVDKIIDKIQKSKVGRFANETTVSSAVAIAYSISAGISNRVARSKLFAWGSFGATAVLGAGIAGLREKKRQKEERAADARDRAKGKKFSQDEAPRRTEMAEVQYETKEANALADALEQSVYRTAPDGTVELRDLTQAELDTALANLAEVESRISISDRQKADLISYSDATKVSSERLRLDVLRARAKVDLRSLVNGEVKVPGTRGVFDYKIDGLAPTDEIEAFLQTPEYQNEADELKRKKLLAYWLHEHRLRTGFKVDDIESVHASFSPESASEYEKWDWYRAEEMLLADKAAAQSQDVVLGTGLAIPDGKTVDEYLASLSGARIESLIKGDQGMEARDALFRSMSNKKVASAVVKGLVTGLVVGATVQELGSFFKSGQEGLLKGLFHGHKAAAGVTHMTSLEYLRRYFTGDLPQAGNGAMHEAVVDGVHVKLPDGVDLVKGSSNTYQLMRDGHVLSDHISFDHGHLVGASAHSLAEQGVVVAAATETIQGVQPGEVTPTDYVHAHSSQFTHVHRGLWYGNDTPAPVFDQNELRADLAIDHHTGAYEYSVARMTPDGSYETVNGVKLSADAHALAAAGHLKMLLSLSRDTQNQVVEVPIGADFKAHIDPNSEIGKLFFQTDAGGKAHFIGQFGEVGQTMGIKDGIEQVRLLATDVGKGLKSVIGEVPTTMQVPVTAFSLPADYMVDAPPFIPIIGRRPLEPESRENVPTPVPVPPRPVPVPPKKIEDITDDTREYYYGYGGESYGLLDRKEYARRLSPELAQNKDLDLSGNDSEIVHGYLEKQDGAYMAELKQMEIGQRAMSKNIDTVITVPAYQEGKNIEKTIRNYAKLKNRDRFEIVILENHPENVSRDSTGEVIERVKAQFPDLNIVHLYKVFKEKPAIGEVRKYLADSVLLRKEEARVGKSVAIVSNDADLEDISEDYADRISMTFKNNKEMDALAGKWDFPAESFKQFPLFHATQRLWHYLDIAFRSKYLKSPELIGRNSAFRSGAYAAVGGYNETSQLAEDMEIGWMIKNARGYEAKRVGYQNSAWLVSNPRRAVAQMISGGRLIQQYGDFHVNDEVRKASLEDLLREKRDFDEGGFATEVQSIYDHYNRWKKSKGGWADDEYLDMSFDRAMRFLGVTYRKEADTVVVTGTTRLREGLEKYGKPKAAPVYYIQ